MNGNADDGVNVLPVEDLLRVNAVIKKEIEN
jgi:hypothetical protein